MNYKEITNRKHFANYINAHNLKVGIEIGTDTGGFSHYILKNSNIERWFTIDVYNCFSSKMNRTGKGQLRAAIAVDVLSQFGDRVVMIRADSRTIYDIFQDEYFDLIHIDGAHKYDFIKEDIRVWYPKCKIGGLFTGHDYAEHHPQHVKKAVDEFGEANKLDIHITSDKRLKCWVTIKK